MLAHVIDRLGPQVGPIALNANGDPERFAAFGLPVVCDTVSGFAGPLAGVLAGMEWALRIGAGGYLLAVPGDTPFFPGDLW
jgi:molybdopterin-guanine dinucleotide biosynthesis protein A